MKKLLFVMLLLAGVTSFALGQERTKRIVELKIGLSVTGYIMELEDGNYMLETDSGDIIFYSRDEIRSIKNPEEVKKEAESNTTTTPVTKNSIPKRYSLQSLLAFYEIQAKLDLYKGYLVEKKRRKAREIEDELWEIEKKVSDNSAIPESVRKEFVDYIESAEDDLEDKAKLERKRK